MDGKSTRRICPGKAMLKCLPDAITRLGRNLLLAGPLPDRLQAMQITHELELAERLNRSCNIMCRPQRPHSHQAVMIIGELPAAAETVLSIAVLYYRIRSAASGGQCNRGAQSIKTEYLSADADASAPAPATAANAPKFAPIKAMHKIKVKRRPIFRSRQCWTDERASIAPLRHVA